MDVMKLINKNSTDVKGLRSDHEKHRQRTEGRLEDLGDKGRGRTESIVALQKELA